MLTYIHIKYNKYDMYRFVLILAPKVYIISSVLYNFSFHIICMCVLICIYVSDRELMKSIEIKQMLFYKITEINFFGCITDIIR